MLPWQLAAGVFLDLDSDVTLDIELFYNEGIDWRREGWGGLCKTWDLKAWMDQTQHAKLWKNKSIKVVSMGPWAVQKCEIWYYWYWYWHRFLTICSLLRNIVVCWNVVILKIRIREAFKKIKSVDFFHTSRTPEIFSNFTLKMTFQSTKTGWNRTKYLKKCGNWTQDPPTP